ncbi:ankyrin repeat domain-containing protein [Spirosoma rhododendri]|uniref:Ankyrin repeat domain-containing protein n=1 Tax=Spirosoma rhododendri TaxID=2728024 RepID=A0A7L5DPH8_9BACT|nr:ankyrin repeat domain-containing protein [Spirosoma rhododendri]QJD80394.1 ankyrin repeat domain-containing protein [Spirosoma rhododendri]
MNKLVSVVLMGVALSAQAQKNTLLEQSFWQTKPGVDLVKAEVEKGNSPSQFNGSSFDPVVLAINAQAPNETINYLLAQPGNGVDKITHDSRNYLHWAAMRGNGEIVQNLLGKGAKVSAEDSHGTTPLNFAAGAGMADTQVYDMLIKGGANLKKDVNHDGANALLLAVAADKALKLTDYFVSKGLDLKSMDANGDNAFGYAARSGNIDLLKALQQRGVPVDPNAMIMAAQGSRRGPAPAEVFQYLESVGVKPSAVNKSGENALHALVRRPGQTTLIEYFIGKGADVNQADEDGNTPFMNAAASNRDIATLELLTPKVKNINQGNAKGTTALALAVRGNSPEVVTYLLGKGADINVTDKAGDNVAAYLIQGYRPAGPAAGPGGMAGGPGMGSAAGQARPEGGMGAPRTDDFSAKMALLQQKGLDVKAPQQNGNTLYHLAVAKNDMGLLKKLEPLQIDINARNKEGITALHKAAMISKDDAMMKYLLSIGAKKDISTNFKETAYDLASENESLSKGNVSLTFLK